MNLTKREKVVVYIAGAFLLSMAIINPSQTFMLENEIYFLIFLVAPLSIYITTDRERSNMQ